MPNKETLDDTEFTAQNIVYQLCDFYGIPVTKRQATNDEAIDFVKALIATSNKEAVTKFAEGLEAEFDRHAESIGLWGAKGAELDILVMHGIATEVQKDERNAMVTERRAMAVLRGSLSKVLATYLTKETK